MALPRILNPANNFKVSDMLPCAISFQGSTMQRGTHPERSALQIHRSLLFIASYSMAFLFLCVTSTYRLASDSVLTGMQTNNLSRSFDIPTASRSWASSPFLLLERYIHNSFAQLSEPIRILDRSLKMHCCYSHV